MKKKRFYLEDNNFYIVAVASKWYLAYLVTYYFTFIYTAIIDSIIGSIATCNIKKRCLCPSIFDSQGCRSRSKDFQSAFDIDILFIFIYTAIIGIITGGMPFSKFNHDC